MSKLDFDSAIRRFDPSRPSQLFLAFRGFRAPGHGGHSGTDGTPRTHKTRHTALDLFCGVRDMKPLPYDWTVDAYQSWKLACRMMALARGAVNFQTVTEMYWIESKGGTP